MKLSNITMAKELIQKSEELKSRIDRAKSILQEGASIDIIIKPRRLDNAISQNISNSDKRKFIENQIFLMESLYGRLLDEIKKC